jgi:uncharacterized protein YcfL
MKKMIYAFVFTLIIASCATERYLPDEVEKEVVFDMPLNDFLSLKNSKVEKQDDNASFRHVYLENLANANVDYIGYYFDADGHKPLYEVIIGCKNETDRDKMGESLFGARNAEDNTEWHLKPKDFHEIKAWTFKNKLIITALIPNTEWFEDVYGK